MLVITKQYSKTPDFIGTQQITAKDLAGMLKSFGLLSIAQSLNSNGWVDLPVVADDQFYGSYRVYKR